MAVDVQTIIAELVKQYGSNVDVNKAKNLLGGLNLQGKDMSQIVTMLASQLQLGDLDGDGKVESLADELKGVAMKQLGNLFK